jgi:GntR family transcriptional regulator, transcriptional repressor for pyruvate dehydrogenase complex
MVAPAGSAVVRLEEYVLRGGFRPGDKLPSEREFTELLGFSRTAVREAVKQLNQKGLIQSSVGRGLFVAERSTTAVAASLDTVLHLEDGRIGDVMEMRRVIGVAAARMAATRATAADLATMRAHVEEMASTFGVPRAMGVTGTAFHLAVARASHNPVLSALAETIMALTDRARREMTWRATRRGLEDHQRIYVAIAAHDADAAGQAMEAHLDYLEHLLTTNLPGWRDLPVPPPAQP